MILSIKQAPARITSARLRRNFYDPTVVSRLDSGSAELNNYLRFLADVAIRSKVTTYATPDPIPDSQRPGCGVQQGSRRHPSCPQETFRKPLHSSYRQPSSRHWGHLLMPRVVYDPAASSIVVDLLLQSVDDSFSLVIPGIKNDRASLTIVATDAFAEIQYS